MAQKKFTTHFTSNQSPSTTYGLAQMKNHWKAEDGQIEECSTALWDSWPVQEALKESPKDPKAVLALATLAGRMFLAGECNKKNPTLSLSASTPVSEPMAAVVDALAQAIYSFPQGEPEQTILLADQLDAIRCQPDISKETCSVITQLVLALLKIKVGRKAGELHQNTEALMDLIPQGSIDEAVEGILRRSQEEGDAL
jgi:hypothetical protein